MLKNTKLQFQNKNYCIQVLGVNHWQSWLIEYIETIEYKNLKI